MTRDEKINFLIKAIDAIEGIELTPEYFEEYSDAKLDDEVEWMDYLLDK
jgi:hypothetical protein